MSQEAMKKIKSFADEMKQETKADYYSSWILIYAYARFLMQDQETVLADITEEAQKKEVKDVFQKARDMKLQPSQMADAMRLLLLDNAFSAKKDVCVLYARQVEKTLPSMRGCFRKLVDAYGPLFSAFCKDYDLNAVVTAIKETYDPLDKKSPIAVKDLSAQNEGTHDSDQPAAEPAVESSSPVKSPEETAATPPTDAASAISDISKMPKDGKKRGKGDDKGTTEAEKEVQSQSQRPDQKLDALSLVCRDLYAALSNTVLGQADAIRFFVKGYFQSELLKGSSQNQNKPKAVFLFAGPPGVGKTFLAEEAAKQLKKAVLRLNMSEYADHQAHLDLIGTSKKFSGSDNGNLTLFVRQHPDGIIIFDEIEKAHRNVLHLFLQILDTGTLRDEHENADISFRETMLFFTTNAGASLYEDVDKNLTLLDSTVIMDALSREIHPTTGMPLFPSSICSRFVAENVIMFNHLSCHHLQQIVQKNFDECAALMEEKYGYRLTMDEWIAPIFLFSRSSMLDARIISAQSGKFIRDEIYEFGRQAVERADLGLVEEIHFTGRIPEAEPKYRKLFVNEQTTHVLIVGDDSPDGKYHIPLDSPKLDVGYVKSPEELKESLLTCDVSILLIDPKYGYRKGGADVFSLDDINSRGIRCFHMVRSTMPELPVYMIDFGKKMAEVDKTTLLQLGAREVLPYTPEESDLFLEKVQTLADSIYMQERINDLSRRGRILHYNTAQKISEDGKKAWIEFYDFQLQTAVTAENQGFVMDVMEKPDVSFSDVIGAENAKAELKFFIRYLKNPREVILKNEKPAKGILLYGPPGTGKTMLAKAMAGEADVTFLPMMATDFMDKYFGEGEKRIRKVFKAARRYSPSVIFIDEIDAIAKERTGEYQHTEALLNTLLMEMDGFSFDPAHPVFVLAATNFALDRNQARGRYTIDPALLRRFDNKIYVDLPNQEERKEFLHRKLAAGETKGITEETINNLAERTTGESLSNLENIVALALRKARRNDEEITNDILLEAMEEYYYGESRKWGRDYYEKVARHEAGHAYICHLSGEKASFLTITSRGDFGGYMQRGNEEDHPSYTKDQLVWRIRTALAGRASEVIFYGDEGLNTGVSSDLDHATTLALKMICKYGMGDGSLLSFEVDKLLSGPGADNILKEANNLLNQEMAVTLELVEKGREKIDRLAVALLEKNQLLGEEIEGLLS